MAPRVKRKLDGESGTAFGVGLAALIVMSIWTDLGGVHVGRSGQLNTSLMRVKMAVFAFSKISSNAIRRK